MFFFFTLKYYANKTSCNMSPSSQGTVGFPAAAGSHELLLTSLDFFYCLCGVGSWQQQSHKRNSDFPVPTYHHALLLKHKYACGPQGSKSLTENHLGGSLIQFQTHTSPAASPATSGLSLRFACPLNATQRLLRLPHTAVLRPQNAEKNHSAAKCLQPSCQATGGCRAK